MHDILIMWLCVSVRKLEAAKLAWCACPFPCGASGLGRHFKVLTAQATQPLHESHEMLIGLELMGLWAAFEVAFI